MLVLHCNFSLRGKESDMDEQFVKRFCDSYGIAHSVKKFDTLKYARENGLSVEMAARELRYTWFREMKEKKKMDYIGRRPSCRRCCRNRFDQSLPGNRYKRANRYKIHQRRHPSSSAPMFADRYTEIHRRPPIGVSDRFHNNSLDYVRNKIRHQIIPVLKEINPSFLDTMTENCETLKETEEIFQYGIHRFQEEILDCEEDELLIHISKTLATPAPYTFLYETLKPFGFNKVQIRDILNTHTAIPGKQFIAGHHTLERGRIFWRLYDQQQMQPDQSFQFQQQVFIRSEN